MTPLTILASDLTRHDPHLLLESTAGRLTVLSFAPLADELTAFMGGTGVYDLGWMTHIAVRGEDHVRWLSGMVTNAVQQLPEGQGNYSFLLNAQGRIQGDASVYREATQIVVAVEADQARKLLAHLDHFIIMDDVTLELLDGHVSAIGLAGPRTLDLLTKLRLTELEPPTGAAASIHPAVLNGLPLSIVRTQPGATPRYEVWCRPSDVGEIWRALIAAGAQPCGLAAVETLRVLEGIPRYGIDVNDRDLAQETSQTRALSFSKGCYLGQEIVERIRSRGAVHRGLRQFKLSGEMPSLPCDLMAGGSSIGKLTSAIRLPRQYGGHLYAMGIMRTDAVTHGGPLTYNGVEAMPLDRPPALPLLNQDQNDKA